VTAIRKTNKCSGGIEEELLLEHELGVLKEIMESKTKYRRVIQAAIAQWVKDFQVGLIKIQTVDDLKKLIEIDLELQKDDL